MCEESWGRGLCRLTRPRCFADNHDIISMKLYQLMVEHSPEEENQDWSKIEPSVSLLKSPKGGPDTEAPPLSPGRRHEPLTPILSFCFIANADNIDDPTGNFRGSPLTGWKVFLLLLCSLLGIVVCAVVGAVVFQKRQERNKRFY